MNRAGLVIAVVAAGCLLLSQVGKGEQLSPSTFPTAESGVVRVGDQAPIFRLRDLAGNLVDLSGLRGKVVLLNFWATWCGPCRVEMPSMEVLYRSYRDKGLEILAVSVDEQGPAVTRPFQEDRGLTFPILHDRDYQVGLLYGARSLPMTYIIDRKGTIRERVFGSREWDTPDARQSILKILEESAALPFQNSSQMM